MADTPSGRHLPGQTPPRQTLWADNPWVDTPQGRHPLPSACWDTHPLCPVHAGIHTPSAQCMLGYTPLPSACWDTHTHPCLVHAWIHTPLPSVCWYTPPRAVHAGIRSTSWRYVSHWNLFLLKNLIIFKDYIFCY